MPRNTTQNLWSRVGVGGGELETRTSVLDWDERFLSWVTASNVSASILSKSESISEVYLKGKRSGECEDSLSVVERSGEDCGGGGVAGWETNEPPTRGGDRTVERAEEKVRDRGGDGEVGESRARFWVAILPLILHTVPNL